MTTRCLRLAQITDTHLSASPEGRVHDIVTDKSARAVLDAIAEFEPDALVATGDLADDGAPEAYRRLDHYLRGFSVPVYVLPGNHDDARRLATAPGVRYRMTRRAELGRWRLHFLNSAIPGRPEGDLGATEIERLEAALDHRPSLVFVHHHPMPIDSPWIDAMGLIDGPELVRRLADHSNVAAVCCGHVHQAVTGWSHGVRWLTTPSTCSQAVPFRDTFIDDERPPGFRWFRLYDNGGWETGVTRIGSSAGR